MLRYLAVGIALGLLSGSVPGPFSALVVATGLEGGFWAAFWIAVVPLLSESVVLILSALFLSQMPRAVLQWMGIAGGLLLLYLAYRTWHVAKNPPEADPSGTPSRKRLFEGVALAVLSPAPWVFWLLVGGPLFLSAWRAGWGHGLVFLGAFLVGLVGVHLLVAALAGYGHHKLPDRWHRRLGKGTAVLLVIASGVLVWQSWVGNFEQLVRGSEEIQQEIVGDSVTQDSDTGSIR